MFVSKVHGEMVKTGDAGVIMQLTVRHTYRATYVNCSLLDKSVTKDKRQGQRGNGGAS